MPTLSHYLVLSLALFSIGVAGVLIRRNIIVMLMSLELVFNSVNISLAAFSYFMKSLTGTVFVIFSITIAAAEVGHRAGHPRRCLQAEEDRVRRRT